MTRLMEKYKNNIVSTLQSELKIGNILAVPKIEKIVINTGIGKTLQQSGGSKALDNIKEAIAKITGQQPVVTRAKKAIAGFKIRENQAVGLTVTLRGKRMYDFLDKFINVVMPRTRDFRGLPKNGFDGRGNYSVGLREQIAFPEMAEAEVEGAFGLQITIVTTAKSDTQGYALLKKFNFPVKD